MVFSMLNLFQEQHKLHIWGYSAVQVVGAMWVWFLLTIILENPFYLLIKVGQVSSTQPQDLSLMKLTDDSTCIDRGIIAHELLHALGIWHEQSRSDRDNFVTINWNNIKPGFESNFYIQSTASLLGTSYDLKSIMHYGSYAFSGNGLPTIVAKNPSIQLPDYHQSLTNTDVAGIRFLYKSSATTTRPTTTRPTTTTANSCPTNLWI